MKNVLEIKNLSVEVDGKELLHDINLTIPKGEVHTLLAPNGSGKTTLIMTIMGFTQYKVMQGRILFDEMERDLNAGLSGGEIKRSELLQLRASKPKFSMMDEPDSGVDLESLALIGNMINKLFSIDSACSVRRRAGLIITHTGHILHYVDADKAHIMLAGRVSCSGNPRLVLDMIKEHGYEDCVHCIPK